MRICLVRVACTVYWLCLTVLLLAPDPLALLGIAMPPGPKSGRMVHFLVFTVLAALVCASRWPVRRGLLAGVLVAFALLTESLQILVPPRTVEVLDYVENLAGLAAGGAIWWLVQKWLGAWHPQRDGASEIPDVKSPTPEQVRRKANHP